MSADTSYSLFVYKQRSWEIDSVYDDQEVAVFEARMLLEEGISKGARIVREGGETPKKVVFQKVIKAEKKDNTQEKVAAAKATLEHVEKRKSKIAGVIVKHSMLIVIGLLVCAIAMIFIRAILRDM
ncbi:MAG: hypothetical protein HON65_11715 [Rhodospirillales bacterium]|jgi:hypothetical protein|nr:hypothetical protein [Rhodospirillales bacterium]